MSIWSGFTGRASALYWFAGTAALLPALTIGGTVASSSCPVRILRANVLLAFLRRLGYGLARGSSSRGGLKALAEMARWLRNGKDAGFTVDGPRGPRYEVKPGPVLLAKRTGDAILCFHVSLQRKIQLNTWDHTQIPIPFSKAFILSAPPFTCLETSTRTNSRAKSRKCSARWTSFETRPRGIGSRWTGAGSGDQKFEWRSSNDEGQFSAPYASHFEHRSTIALCSL